MLICIILYDADCTFVLSLILFDKSLLTIKNNLRYLHVADASYMVWCL